MAAIFIFDTAVNTLQQQFYEQLCCWKILRASKFLTSHKPFYQATTAMMMMTGVMNFSAQLN
jgi:hypothetical protein